MTTSNSEESTKFISPSERGITIGQLADLVSRLNEQRCTTAMIYNYERLGLLPAPERSSGGFRLYKLEDVKRVALIKRWQEKGLSLVEIKERLGQSQNVGEELNVGDLPIDRRTQILQAALTVFLQKGYLEATIQDIAQEAGISSAAIYLYFDSKEDLFLSLIESLSFQDVLEEINSVLEHKEEIEFEDVRQALIKAAEAFLDTHHPNAEVIRLFIAEGRRFPEIGISYCQRLVAPVESLLERYIENQIRRGIFREIDPKLAVHAFFGIFLNFVVTQDLLHGKHCLSFPSEDRVPKLVDLYLNGILPRTANE